MVEHRLKREKNSSKLLVRWLPNPLCKYEVWFICPRWINFCQPYSPALKFYEFSGLIADSFSFGKELKGRIILNKDQ